MNTPSPLPTTLPPLPRDQHRADADHLKLLAVFHFVGAGLAVFGMLFVLLHYTMMHAFLGNPQFWQNQKNPMPNPMPPQFFEIFKWVYVFFAAWFLVSLILNLISALCLLGRKGRTFSMVVAGFNCLHIPLGTVLGVFTIIVLLRDSVRELYEDGR